MNQLPSRPVADARIEVNLTPTAREDSGVETELLWATALGDRRFEVCSVPTYAYNLNLGDVVACEEGADHLPRVVRVIQHCGKQTLRLLFSASARPALAIQVLARLRSRGAIVEPFGSGNFGVAVSSFAELGVACQYICESDPDEHIAYEAGFRPGEPFFDVTLPLEAGNA